MLPKTLIISLPYLTIFFGALSGVVFDSTIVQFFSALLMLAGFIGLWMHQHSQSYSGTQAVPKVRQSSTRSWNDIFQAEQERRMLGTARSFPLIDGEGKLIPFDRRANSGRRSGAA